MHAVTLPGIPEHYHQDAEMVRAHLVHLRGGAPFLSPSDALCLVGWLDRGVKVTAILRALERCAVRRRELGSHTRFTLRQAGRHLGKPPLRPVSFEPVAGTHPFQPLQAVLAASPHPVDAAVAGELVSLPVESPEILVHEAVRITRAHRERAWRALPRTEREARIATARTELGDAATLIKEDLLLQLCEEIARDAFRAELAPVDIEAFTALAGA